MLLRKYVGETPRMTRAIFTAAVKIQPCMVFIDEMDALFRARQSNDMDHAHGRDLITECTYDTVLYCTVKYCVIMYWLNCAVLHCTVPYCTVLQCTEMY